SRRPIDAPSHATCPPSSATPNSCTTAVANATSNYYDPCLYTPGTNVAAETTLGVNAMNTTTNYRRKYVNMALSNGADKFSADTISVTHDIDVNSAYAKFEAPTRLSILKAALYQAIVENTRVARFGLVRMRQRTPVTSATIGNSGPVTDANVLQQGAGITTDRPDGKWNI